jgi:hypothetical protein
VAGAALASEQLDFENFANSGRELHRGDVLMHGLTLGLAASW